MNLPLLLAAPLSKKSVLDIIVWVGQDATRFEVLMDHFINGSNPVVQRSAWPLSYCAIQHPQLISKKYPILLKALQNDAKPPAVKRNVLRLLDQGPLLPKRFHGQIMNECFEYLLNPGAPIAVVAFSIGILERLSAIYPEIIPEIHQAIELLPPNSSPGVRSRAQRFIRNQQKRIHKKASI